jgi:lauroyl/myristoyl acyltransferase
VRFARPYDLYVLLVALTIVLVERCPVDGTGRLAGAVIGSIAHRLSRHKRRLSEERVAAVFADTATSERTRAIVEEAFRRFWQDQFPSSRGDARYDRGVVGIEHLNEALARGRGAILWEAAPFGRRMAAKRILRDEGLAIHQVHSDNHLSDLEVGPDLSLVQQRFFQAFFDRQELRFVAELLRLPRDNAVAGRRTLLRRLRDNGILCMGNDGSYGRNVLSVPFLGHARGFASGFVTLTRASGAPILPIFCVETSAGCLQVVIEEALRLDETLERDGAARSMATQYVTLLESYVLRYPGEYRAWHKLTPLSEVPSSPSTAA